MAKEERMKSVSLRSVAVRASHVEKQGRREGGSVYVLSSEQRAWGTGLRSICIQHHDLLWLRSEERTLSPIRKEEE